jgi:hypothetical protein
MNSVLVAKIIVTVILAFFAWFVWSVFPAPSSVVTTTIRQEPIERVELSRGAANYLIPGHAIEWREDAGGGVTITTLFAQNGTVVYLIDGRPVDRETFYRWLDAYVLRQDRAKGQP